MACDPLLESSNCPESNAGDHFLLAQIQHELAPPKAKKRGFFVWRFFFIHVY